MSSRQQHCFLFPACSLILPKYKNQQPARKEQKANPIKVDEQVPSQPLPVQHAERRRICISLRQPQPVSEKTSQRSWSVVRTYGRTKTKK
jgi:hypothetical protein